MIGFGSNRLTVCRRGGMSVTQAGRGGMEWLAGGRGPSWASPYSAAATVWILNNYGDQWQAIKQYGHDYPEVVPYVNATPSISLWLVTYEGFHDILVNNHLTFETPIVAADTTDNNKKMWLIRPGQQYTNWNLLDNIMSQTDWDYKLGGFSSGAVGGNTYCTLCGTQITAPRTIVRFFVPDVIPTGYAARDADGVVIYVNNTQIFSGTHRNRADVTYDFSNIIQLGMPNFVVIAWRGSGGHGEDFGFSFS